MILPNQRWICLPSDNLGRDWWEKSIQIDQKIPEWGMDLSEESVYIFFDRAPGAVIHEEGSALIARPVIGPRKVVSIPFQLRDWVAQEVHRAPIIGREWPQILAEAYSHWEKLQREGKKPKIEFFLTIKRKLDPKFMHEMEVIFHE